MVNSFKFTRVDTFIDDINREDCFDTRDMDGVTQNYRFILASHLDGNSLDDWIDEDGTLNLNNVTLVETDGSEDGLCALQYGKGINGERSISIADPTINYDLGEKDENIRAIFLVSIANGSGYVMAYCILDKSIMLDGKLILPTDGLIWSIRYG